MMLTMPFQPEAAVTLEDYKLQKDIRKPIKTKNQEDDDVFLPRASLNKFIKETLPEYRLTMEARELLLQCSNEFIHMLATESNDVCSKNSRRTISGEHVIGALTKLGMGHYVAGVQPLLTECKDVAVKRRKSSKKLEHLGIPEEELLRQQQELFAQARIQALEMDQLEWAKMQQECPLEVNPDDEDDYDYDSENDIPAKKSCSSSDQSDLSNVPEPVGGNSKSERLPTPEPLAQTDPVSESGEDPSTPWSGSDRLSDHPAVTLEPCSDNHVQSSLINGADLTVDPTTARPISGRDTSWPTALSFNSDILARPSVIVHSNDVSENGAV